MSESFEKAVEAGARRVWIERAVMEWCDRDWAESAWDDMGGSEPSIERIGTKLQFHDALTVALSHLTAEDVPHLIRRAKAEAWEVGARTAWDRSTATVNGQTHYWRHSGKPANPYAEEADHEQP